MRRVIKQSKDLLTFLYFFVSMFNSGTLVLIEEIEASVNCVPVT